MRSVVGQYRGFTWKRARIRSVFPGDEGKGNPLLYFAFDRDGLVVVTGVRTQRELFGHLDTEAEERQA